MSVAANSTAILDTAHFESGFAQAIKLIETGHTCADYDRVGFTPR